MEEFHNFNEQQFGRYKRFRGVRIRSGSVVDAIQFIYDKDDSLGWYGGPGGALSEFFFADGEFITRVDWTTGMWEDYPLFVTAYVCFRTNKGREFAAGKKNTCRQCQNHTVCADEGMYFHSFSGRYERYFLGFDTCYHRTMNLLKFDDTLHVQGRRCVTEIRLNTGWVVDGIQIVYDGDKQTSFHGGPGGSRTTLRLASDEHISCISGKIGKYEYQVGDTLCHIEITTDKGNCICGGTMQGCSNMKDFCYRAEAGEQIFAFTGEYSVYMRSLEAGMYTLKGSAPAGECVQMSMESADEECAPGKAMSLQGMEGASLRNALKSGCFDEDTLKDMVEATFRVTEPGGRCRECLEQRAYEIQSTALTRNYINTPQYIFRSPLGWEMEYNVTQRKMRSKYQKYNRNYTPVIDLNKQNGEQYKYATTLRALAIKSSSDPMSQFVSVALDFETARGLGQGDLVLAYKLIPNSPLLGLKEGGKLGGEDQFQVLGGTEIIEFYKFTHKKWYQYDFNEKDKKKAWKATRRIPFNQEYNELRYGGEL